MAPSLRGRLVCFYCGCRSAQTRKPQIRRWQCEKCEAVNHLDENGEITDPPAAESSSNARYATSIQRPTSPVFNVPEDPLFCQTCLKNQHIFSESLASYFPSQDAPNYTDYENQYPKFREELEERYPQVCEKCEPRVRERIRATGYAAKTDHLRRLMEQTRGGGVPHERSRWRIFFVFIGGTSWAMSIAGQVAWDGLTLLSYEQNYGELIEEDVSASGSTCLYEAMRGSALPPDCTTLGNLVARYSLLLGILSFWWNPKLQERLNKIGGRIVGKSEYYKLQAIFLVARCLAWVYLVELPGQEAASQATKGIHGALLFFGALSTIMSFRAISIDYTPRVVFQDSPEPPISRRPELAMGGIGSEASNFSIRESKSYAARSIPSNQSFSINDLAPLSRQQYPAPYQSPYQPPTPPPDEDDDEAMDWTPSQQATLRPATLYRPSPPPAQQQYPTPFRGHLPADVVSLEHRLRNPPNKPTFRKASESQKQNFFRTPGKSTHRNSDTVSESGTEYEPSIAETVTPAMVRFAEPKLRVQAGQHADTGLERLLANAFSLDDEPQEVRALKQGEMQVNQRVQSSDNVVFTAWHRIPVLFLLSAAYFVWRATPKPIIGNLAQIQTLTLLTSSLASIRSLVLSLRKRTIEWSGSDLVIFSAELLASITLVFAVNSPPTRSSIMANRLLLNSLGATLMAIMAVQELWLLILDLWTARNNDNLPLLATDSVPVAKSPPSQQQSVNKGEFQTTTPAPAHMLNSALGPVQHSTRSRTKENSAIPANGLGSLSLGGSGGSGQLGSRRSNRSGMW